MLSRMASMTSLLLGGVAASLHWLRPRAQPPKSKPPQGLLLPAALILAATRMRLPLLLRRLSLAH